MVIKLSSIHINSPSNAKDLVVRASTFSWSCAYGHVLTASGAHLVLGQVLLLDAILLDARLAEPLVPSQVWPRHVRVQART